MKRILFVDDDPAVLDAMQDRLRKQRHKWEMVFTSSGEQALAACQAAPFDVVVSDMRMPGMDGATLLQRIKDEYPSTVRIVFSGHAEREAVMRALPVAHQYLGKPCDFADVRNIIERACALQDMMGDVALRAIVGRVERLPTLPKLYSELTEVLSGSAPAIGEIAKIVERDPAMCLKLLQVVNSAFFGLPRRVATVREAISYLGTELLKSLVLAGGFFATAAGRGVADQSSLDAVQRHSTLVARAARSIARSNRDEAFMGGMLHDVGEVVLTLADPKRYRAIREEAKRRAAPLWIVEREHLGVTHAEVGAYVLGTWGLPFAIVEAVAAHHEPGRFASLSVDATTAVHVAEALVAESEAQAPPLGEPASSPVAEVAASGTLLDEAYLLQLGVAGEVASWRAMVLDLDAGAKT